jgi:hypothetical protein
VTSHSVSTQGGFVDKESVPLSTMTRISKLSAASRLGMEATLTKRQSRRRFAVPCRRTKHRLHRAK